MTVKPSRGTVVFFVLLALGLAVRFGLGRREESLIARDAPRTGAARRLFRCVLGPDIQRALWPRPPGDDAGPWEAVIAGRLYRSAMAHYERGAWPARCLPLNDALLQQLGISRDDRMAMNYAMQLRYQLGIAAQSRLSMLESVETRTLSRTLAQLAMAVSSLSDGAQETWNSPIPASSTDLTNRREQSVAAVQYFPEMADSTVLALPDLALYQSALERSLHLVPFDAQGHMQADRVLGDGAPVRGSREGVVRVSSDSNEQLFLPEGEPSQRVSLPEPYRSGERELGEWQVLTTHGALWLLGVHHGALSLWRTARTGAVQWTSVALAPELGDGTALGAALLAEVPGDDALGLMVLRRGANSEAVSTVRIERWPSVVPAAVPVSPAGAPRRAQAVRAVVPTPSHDPAADVWTAFHPQLRTCQAGDVRYMLVGADDGLNLLRIEGSRVERRYWIFSENEVPTGATMELSCQRDGALVHLDLVRERGVLWSWTEAQGDRGQLHAPPRYGQDAVLSGAVLTATRGVLALVTNHQTTRAFFTRDLGVTWTGGDLVLMQNPRTANRWDASDFQLVVRTLTVQGDRVGVLGEAQLGQRVFTGWFGSRDGGQSWL